LKLSQNKAGCCWYFFSC